MSKKQKKSNIKFYIKIVIYVAILIAGTLFSKPIVHFFTQMFKAETTITQKVTKIGFEDIGELATESAYVTTVSVTDKSRKIFDITIPLTESKMIYSYDSIIKAGYNFNDIKWNIDNEKKTIKVSFPKMIIISNDLDEKSLKVYHEDESIFTNVTMKESNEARIKMKQKALKNALANGFEARARKNAEVIIKSFFKQQYKDYKYQIDWR
ncbi:DUF4230 domain-containing protein [Kandleria vitulina]|jgi:hypothetical protein|uniref:DUF4230 domain-containing protein n=1 Tax=Kandleria vitulina TaxID=1630 RepID=UPI00048A65FA|nr:DUF4230 domain-containing protein [Kandleria vitulina]MEE0989536.1 DUF4230 domain-containing protein [Kandleria vitulina]SEI76141.1 Protein of unknown function [Kandleria vitulina]HAD23019.1 DUF4230 domain-containing protein [Kandleria vitulina]HBG67844.1 DUF4230 domain-containing protein [Kandleria vitulina]